MNIYSFFHTAAETVINDAATTADTTTITTGNSTDIFQYGFLLGIVILVIMFLMNWKINSPQSIKDRLDKYLQSKKTVESNINEINKTQELLSIELDKLESLSEENKKNIDTIIETAAKQITEILNADETTKNEDIRIIVDRIRTKF